ncbi:MAG: protein CpxP [Algoriphagus sp.]|jgi:protein CpxP
MKVSLTIAFILSSVVSFSQVPGGGRPGGAGFERPSAEQRAKFDTKKMTKKLDLSEVQEKQFHTIALKYGKLSDAVMGSIPRDQFPPSEETRTKMRRQMMEINKNKNGDLKVVLSSEQFKSYQEIQKEEMSNLRQRGQPRL